MKSLMFNHSLLTLTQPPPLNQPSSAGYFTVFVLIVSVKCLEGPSHLWPILDRRKGRNRAREMWTSKELRKYLPDSGIKGALEEEPGSFSH